MRMDGFLWKILRILFCFIFLLGTTALAALPVSFIFEMPLEGTAPLTVLFTDASDGDVNTWIWDFGDGTISRQKDPMHQYNDPGYYSVTLTISGSGGSDTVTLVGSIFVSESDPQEGNDAPFFGFGNLHEYVLILDNEPDNTSNQKENVKRREKTIPNATATITLNHTPLPEVTQEPIIFQLDPTLYASLSNSTERSENKLEKEETVSDITHTQTPLPEVTQGSINIQLDPALYASLSNSTERSENELENEGKGEREETVPDITHTQTPLPEATQGSINTQLDPALYASLSNSTERSENKLENEGKDEREKTVPDITLNQTLIPEATQEPIIFQLDPTLYASLSNSTERNENELENEGKGEKRGNSSGYYPCQNSPS